MEMKIPFFLDASSEFDFFGFSYDPAYTDDSEVVVIEGSVGSGARTVEFGESTGAVEDWDVVSFDGLDSSVNIDLSQVDANYDAIGNELHGWNGCLCRWCRGCLWNF